MTTQDTTSPGGVVVLGDEQDVAGFALAGVGGRVCHTARDLQQAVAASEASRPAPTLILISPSAAALCPEWIARQAARRSGPVIAVLP